MKRRTDKAIEYSRIVACQSLFIIGVERLKKNRLAYGILRDAGYHRVRNEEAYNAINNCSSSAQLMSMLNEINKKNEIAKKAKKYAKYVNQQKLEFNEETLPTSTTISIEEYDKLKDELSAIKIKLSKKQEELSKIDKIMQIVSTFINNNK